MPRCRIGKIWGLTYKRVMANQSRSSNHAFVGTFLVGLGLIGIFNYWWPGIMFVVAAAILVSSIVEGRLGHDILSVAILTGIGIIGVIGQIDTGKIPVWEILFIAVGGAYLVKTFWKRK